mmetsp:Transcript_51580/g.122120  ORF Transcript_51580/g.122120 Transcript_51580/m.122120 type:complete len:203 (-) Transcript_51580:253-861(-)
MPLTARVGSAGNGLLNPHLRFMYWRGCRWGLMRTPPCMASASVCALPLPLVESNPTGMPILAIISISIFAAAVSGSSSGLTWYSAMGGGSSSSAVSIASRSGDSERRIVRGSNLGRPRSGERDFSRRWSITRPNSSTSTFSSRFFFSFLLGLRLRLRLRLPLFLSFFLRSRDLERERSLRSRERDLLRSLSRSFRSRSPRSL